MSRERARGLSPLLSRVYSLHLKWTCYIDQLDLSFKRRTCNPGLSEKRKRQQDVLDQI
jgi:hypothetical protein